MRLDEIKISRAIIEEYSNKLLNALEVDVATRPDQIAALSALSRAVNDVLTRAEKEAKDLKDEFVSVEHLFLALIDLGKPEAMKKLFKSFGLDRAKVLDALKEVRGSQRLLEQYSGRGPPGTHRSELGHCCSVAVVAAAVVSEFDQLFA